MKRPYQGVFPVVPTTFTETGELDLDSQKRCLDFMIDAGATGLCLLANFSEQFSLSDAEREHLTRTALEHVAGRVPVIVTTSHYASRICAARSRQAQAMGAAMVMVMPPYHGATFRVEPAGIEAFYRQVSDAIDIPIMIQDAPASGTVLPAALLARMAREIEQVAYFKIETAGAASKLRELIALGGKAIEAPGMAKKPSPCWRTWTPAPPAPCAAAAIRTASAASSTPTPPATARRRPRSTSAGCRSSTTKTAKAASSPPRRS